MMPIISSFKAKKPFSGHLSTIKDETNLQ